MFLHYTILPRMFTVNLISFRIICAESFILGKAAITVVSPLSNHSAPEIFWVGPRSVQHPADSHHCLEANPLGTIPTEFSRVTETFSHKFSSINRKRMDVKQTLILLIIFNTFLRPAKAVFAGAIELQSENLHTNCAGKRCGFLQYRYRLMCRLVVSERPFSFGGKMAHFTVTCPAFMFPAKMRNTRSYIANLRPMHALAQCVKLSLH